MADFSRGLYRLLDHLGYNEDMIKFRRERWKYWSDLCSEYDHKGNSYMMTAGSKGEGITSVLESDTDIISLNQNVLTINAVEQLPSHVQNDMTVFLADMENVPPGYTRLKLYQPSSAKNVTNKDIFESLFEMQNGEMFVSSTLFATSCSDVKISIPNVNLGDISGPARSGTNGLSKFDIVLGFTFHCPQLLQKWASRRRRHEWPPQDVIRKASSFLPQVVPVGAKGSDRQFQEWRFCFIESELTLTHSLNGTQIKLYILLKMIAKSTLNRITGEISSYIMKNITYWLSEMLPLHMFREEKLVSLVLTALSFLRTAITRWHNLPYYMIPSRNILSERLDARTQRELSDILSQLVQEGSRLFLRVDKIRNCLDVACRKPNVVMYFGYMHDKLEKCYIALFTVKKIQENGMHSGNMTLYVYLLVHVLVFVFTKRACNIIEKCSNFVYPSRRDSLSYDEFGQMLKLLLS